MLCGVVEALVWDGVERVVQEVGKVKVKGDDWLRIRVELGRRWIGRTIRRVCEGLRMELVVSHDRSSVASDFILVDKLYKMIVQTIFTTF